MPVYDYACETCGPFTVLRPMAQFRDPHDCPDCGSSCGRA
ncbi:FmdB family zinc ribbon protein, partial [uncultured Methylobacterium sp.]